MGREQGKGRQSVNTQSSHRTPGSQGLVRAPRQGPSRKQVGSKHPQGAKRVREEKWEEERNEVARAPWGRSRVGNRVCWPLGPGNPF